MKKMNKLSKMLTLMLALAAVMFSCVEDDYDKPDIQEIPIGEVYTIAQVKDFYNNNGGDYTFTADASVYATVTMDEETDNSYKTFFIQDHTGAVAVFVNTSGGVYIGDSVRVYLKDLKIMKYRELFQINDVTGSNGVDVDDNIIKQGYNNKRVPEEVSLADIIANDDSKAHYQGRLVKITDVQFIETDTAGTLAYPDTQESESRYLQDANDKQMIVRTSGYASFAGVSVPNGSGSIIGIVSQYSTDMQLLIRRMSEVEMESTRFDVTGGGAGSGDGSFDNPYDVEAALSNSSATDVWVEGYLVGVYETVDAGGNTLSEFTPSFTSPFYTNSNVIIAGSDSETDISNCIVIQVPNGDIRTAVNMVDNPGNLSKLIKFKGDRETYFGENGLKSVNGYWLDGDGINPEDPVEIVVLGTSTVVSTLNEDFTGVSADVNYVETGWLNANVQGERYWQGKEYDSNGYIQATAYGATATDIESWVVTPGIDCSVNKQLSFGTKVGYWKHNGLNVLISSDFDGNAANLTTSTWTDITSQCTIPTTPTNGYGTDYTPSVVDLSSYTGETIYILFKYTGDNSSNTTTYQIDNVQVTDL